jgi:uncharacterized membrane protein
MKTGLIAWGSALLTLLLADGLWLGVLMGPTYKAQLGPLMLDQPVWAPALAFYLLYPVGLLVFAVRPGLQAGRWQQAVAPGALLGLVAYGTYDLSNLATLQGWPTGLALMDMGWGIVVSSLCAGVSWRVTRACITTADH